MLSTVAQLILFLSSYAPLFAIFLIRNTFENQWVNIALAAITGTSIIALVLIIRLTSTLATYTISVSSVSSRDSDSMSYIVTYLLPFLGVPFNSLVNGLSFVLLLAVICVIYVNSNMVYINPLLNLAGYHLYQIQDSSGKVSTLITKRLYIPPRGDLSVQAIGDYVMLEESQ